MNLKALLRTFCVSEKKAAQLRDMDEFDRVVRCDVPTYPPLLSLTGELVGQKPDGQIIYSALGWLLHDTIWFNHRHRAKANWFVNAFAEWSDIPEVALWELQRESDRATSCSARTVLLQQFCDRWGIQGRTAVDHQRERRFCVSPVVTSMSNPKERATT